MKTHTLGPLHWEHWPSVVLLFATKLICTCHASYRPKAKLLCSKCMAWPGGVTSAQFCQITSWYSRNSTTWFVARQFWTWVEKGAASLFNSFCSNVENQVARLCCAFYPSFTQCKKHHLNEITQARKEEYHQLSIATLVTHQWPVGFRNLSDYYLPCHSIQEQQLKTAI